MSGIQPNNVFHGCGRLGDEPGKQVLPSGKTIISFSIAIDRTWVTQDGQRQKKTNWIRCVAFHPMSKYIEACHVHKGTKVSVVGSIEIEKYVDNNTQQQKQSFSIWITGFEKQEKSETSERQDTGTQKTAQQPNASANQPPAFQDAMNSAEEDLPF